MTEDNGNSIDSNSQESDGLVPIPDGIMEGAAPIGSITSPSSTQKYKMILRDYASNLQVTGSLVTLDYEEMNRQSEKITKTVLCQVVDAEATNHHHEKNVLRALLREKGRIPGLSGRADNKEVELLPIGSLVSVSGSNVHQLPRNIPPMGTDVRFASAEDVHRFSGDHDTIYNIGHLYETNVPVGLMLKHFGDGDDGWGDAHMLGVFGATGSGKTVMAASIIAGFAARKEMGMLIVDPQGQFSGFELGTGGWSWKLDKAFEAVGRGQDVDVVNMDEVALESPRLFTELLRRNDFFKTLSILGSENEQRTVDDFTSYLDSRLTDKDDPIKKLGDLDLDDDIFHMACTIGAATYANPSDRAKKMAETVVSIPFKMTKLNKIWKQTQDKFGKSKALSELLDDVLIYRRIIILNINVEGRMKDLYAKEILEGIRQKAESIYRIKQGNPWRGDPAKKYEDVITNALIVIDEAHRFAPQAVGKNKDVEAMVESLADAIRTTRKLGVGWFYITQSFADFDKRIFRQIQTKILGIGIGTGVDEEHLQAALNRDQKIVEFYKGLPRPTTTGVFPYAIIGELVALGNGNRGLFVSAPKSQEQLVKMNPRHFTETNGQPVNARAWKEKTSKALLHGTKQIPATTDIEDEIPF
ncbi:MAG: hypothetical protein CL608_07005 [Anaerolineaceae bacterium]|nr:hypothetical protein [Anaerolineaceae bacterium]